MKKTIYQAKCRRCGRNYDTDMESSGVEKDAFVSVVNNPANWMLHGCGDDGYGIADFVGYRIVYNITEEKPDNE